MAWKFANFATTAITASLAAAATSLDVGTTAGALFPTLAGSDTFLAVLLDGVNDPEIVEVTAHSGNGVFTLSRAQEGTSARTWNAGTEFRLTLTAAQFEGITSLAAQTDVDIAGIADKALMYWNNSNSAMEDTTQLFWDEANSRLGINQSAPAYSLDITGTSRITGAALFGSTLGVTGATTLTTLTTSGQFTPSADIIPGTDDTYDLGSGAAKFAEIHGTLVSATSLAGTLTTAAQGNVTSLGNLTGLTMAGLLGAAVDSTYDIGANLTRFANLYVDTLYGAVSAETEASIADLALTTLDMAGLLSAAVDSTYDIGEAATRFANVYADNLYGLIAEATQTNITSLGTLVRLSVTQDLLVGTGLTDKGNGTINVQNGYYENGNRMLGVTAWVAFNGQTGTIVDSGGPVSAITRSAEGQYRLTFSPVLDHANYALAGMVKGEGTGSSPKAFLNMRDDLTNTTQYAYITTLDDSGSETDVDIVHVIVMGGYN